MKKDNANHIDGNEAGHAIRKIVRAAHKADLHVWVWRNELEDAPDTYRIGKQVQMDKSGFWSWLELRYVKSPGDYPEPDGIVLTFHETEHNFL